MLTTSLQTVIAANRDPDSESSKSLFTLTRGSNSELLVLPYDAAVEQTAFDLVKQLRDEHRIGHLDIVIANAGITKIYPLVRDVKSFDMIEHLQVNTFGVVWLYQATRELLQKSPNKPVFTAAGSGAGSLR